VYVVRPAAAWHDVTDPLNFPTSPFRLDNTDVDNGLRTVLQHVAPSIYIPLTIERPRVGSVTTAFRGGTFAEALNALIASGPLHEWEVATMSHGIVVVESSDLEGLWASAPFDVRAHAKRVGMVDRALQLSVPQTQR
jgi:hypothetical protein